MRIIITGHTGFIGGAVARQARSAGHDVIGVSRTAATDAGFPTIARAFHEITEEEIAELEPDAVIHSAWVAEPGVYLHSPANDDYAEQSVSFFQSCIDANVPSFLGVGSCAELSTGDTNPYSAAKTLFRKTAQEAARGTETRFDWAYLFYPYGPGEHPERLCAAMLTQLAQQGTFTIKNPNAKKDYIFIDDLARALVSVASRTGAGQEFQVGSGQARTIADLAQTAAEILGLPPDAVRFGELPPDDPIGDVSANTGLLNGLGWGATTPLHEGLKRLAKSLNLHTS